MSDPVDYEIDIQRYNGSNKPDMPQKCTLKTFYRWSFSFISNWQNRGKKSLILPFLDVITKPECAEFNGYNTAISQEQGHTVKTKTKAVYLPLIDLVPSDSDTMMTALVVSWKWLEKYVIFTCDLQLYQVALHVIWAYPDRFSNKFCWCEWNINGRHWSCKTYGWSIGGVPKMLWGKKFPQNVRAMWMVVEELLRPIILTKTIDQNDTASRILLMYWMSWLGKVRLQNCGSTCSSSQSLSWCCLFMLSMSQTGHYIFMPLDRCFHMILLLVM